MRSSLVVVSILWILSLAVVGPAGVFAQNSLSHRKLCTPCTTQRVPATTRHGVTI